MLINFNFIYWEENWRRVFRLVISQMKHYLIQFCSLKWVKRRIFNTNSEYEWIQNVPRGSLNFNSDNSQLIQKLVPFRKVIHLEFPKKQNFFINKLQFLVTYTMQLQATKDWHRYNTKIKIFPLKFFKKKVHFNMRNGWQYIFFQT